MSTHGFRRALGWLLGLPVTEPWASFLAGKWRVWPQEVFRFFRSASQSFQTCPVIGQNRNHNTKLQRVESKIREPERQMQCTPPPPPQKPLSILDMPAGNDQARTPFFLVRICMCVCMYVCTFAWMNRCMDKWISYRHACMMYGFMFNCLASLTTLSKVGASPAEPEP